MADWHITQEQNFPKGDNPFDNSFYGYRQTALELPDDRHATYHGVLVGDCVHIVALEDDETTYLVAQRRPNARRAGEKTVPLLFELPGGFAERGVSLEDSAQQELIEEVNRRAAKLTPAGVILPAPGISDEHDHIFLGTGLEATTTTLEKEATEQDLHIISGKFGTLLGEMLRSHLPVPAQTISAMAKVAILL